MTGPTDDKKLDRVQARASTSPGVDTVNEDVARVFDLIQRLDKLHAEKGSSPTPPTPPASRADDGLSSMASIRPARAHLRAVSSPAPISYIGPPALPSPIPQQATMLNPPELLGQSSASELPSILSKASAAPKGVRPKFKPQTDRPPVALIASVMIGLTALAAWGLLNLQRVQSAPSGPVARDAVTAPTHASLDTTAAFATLPKSATATKSPCAADAFASARGVVTIGLTDPAQKGSPISFDVGGLIFKSAFDQAGKLSLKAPLLGQTQPVRWTGADGAACEQSATLAADEPLLRIALVWTSDAALDLHVIEPNAWLGSPTGHISNQQPNLSLSQGAGMIESFGIGSDGANAIVYTLDPARIPSGAIVSAFVKPSSVTAQGGSTPDCADPSKQRPDIQTRYQVHILRSGRDGPLHSDIASYVMQVPSCRTPNGVDRAERIMVRNER